MPTSAFHIGRGNLKGLRYYFSLVFKSSLAGEKGERLKLNEVALRAHVAQKWTRSAEGPDVPESVTHVE